MSEPTPEAIEAAAKAEYEHEMSALEGTWEEATKEARALFRQSSAVALSAAAPFLIREAQAQALEEVAEEWVVRSQTFLNTMEHMVESREYSHDDILRYGAYSAEAQTSGYRLRARAAAIRDGEA